MKSLYYGMSTFWTRRWQLTVSAGSRRGLGQIFVGHNAGREDYGSLFGCAELLYTVRYSSKILKPSMANKTDRIAPRSPEMQRCTGAVTQWHTIRRVLGLNKYVCPPYCRAEMYAVRVACCPLVIHGEYADGTDGWTPDRYIKLSARCSQRKKSAA